MFDWALSWSLLTTFVTLSIPKVFKKAYVLNAYVLRKHMLLHLFKIWIFDFSVNILLAIFIVRKSQKLCIALLSISFSTTTFKFNITYEFIKCVIHYKKTSTISTLYPWARIVSKGTITVHGVLFWSRMTLLFFLVTFYSSCFSSNCKYITWYVSQICFLMFF